MIVTLKDIEIHEANKISKWRSDPKLSKIIMSLFKKTSVNEAKRWIRECNKDNNQILKGIYCINGETSEFVGITRLMFINYSDLTAEFGIYIGEHKNHNKGVGEKAVKLTLDIGFNFLRLNKIYLKVLENNTKAVSSFLKNSFKIEGCLKEHYLSNGIFENVLYMAIFKDDYK